MEIWGLTLWWSWLFKLRALQGDIWSPSFTSLHSWSFTPLFLGLIWQRKRWAGYRSNSLFQVRLLDLSPFWELLVWMCGCDKKALGVKTVKHKPPAPLWFMSQRGRQIPAVFPPLCHLWKCVKRSHEWDLMKSRLLSVGGSMGCHSGFINPGTGSQVRPFVALLLCCLKAELGHAWLPGTEPICHVTPT